MEEWGKISKQRSKWLANKRTEQACRWGFKPFICEIRLRKYKSTLIDKGLNYFISVKLLILETIVSQRPWSCLLYLPLYFELSAVLPSSGELIVFSGGSSMSISMLGSHMWELYLSFESYVVWTFLHDCQYVRLPHVGVVFVL